MISYFQAIILGTTQGLTELFPISSLGHSIILPKILNWNIDQNNNYFLSFLVATHLATALVLFLFFYKDWKKIFIGLYNSFKKRDLEVKDGKLGWLIIVGTIPAGIVGLLFQEKLKILFSSPKIVSIFLILNGLVLYFGEYLRKKTIKKKNFNSLSWLQAIKIGTAQILALLPGFSRSGSTLVSGLLVGLSHEEAAKFSFLLATPIIAAAALLKIPELISSNNIEAIKIVAVGAVAAGFSAYFSIKFLMKYFETKTLKPFAIYCVLAGLFLFIILF